MLHNISSFPSEGEVRFAVSGHLKTFVKLKCIDQVMDKAAHALGAGFSLEDVDGFQELDKKQQKEVANVVPTFPRLAGQPTIQKGKKAPKKRTAVSSEQGDDKSRDSKQRKKKRAA